MEVLIRYEYREDDLRAALDCERLVAFVLGEMGCPPSTEVSVSFITDERIHELNLEFRGIDRPTDVLSFECDGAEDEFDMAYNGSGALACDAGEGEPYLLGDIFVAPDVAERQAPDYGMTYADELSLLITHGLLHLCGMDHMEDDEAREMEARETELLSAFWGRPFKRHGLDDGGA